MTARSQFGHSLALTPDGRTAVTGGLGNTGVRGAVWTFACTVGCGT
jgi:hypothetical protein